MLYRGPLFRALNPIYAREPLSGRGAELYGGRFNPKGVPALYSSPTVLIALREANQAGSLQPTTLVSYDAEIDGVFDTRDESALAATGMDAASLADNRWRDQMKATGEARTQAFARDLIAKGYRAMFVRSFAPGATKDDLNLVLWQWGDSLPSRLTLIDDENRLSTNGPEDVKRWLKFLKVERRPSDIRIRDGHFAAIRTVLNSARKAGRSPLTSATRSSPTPSRDPGPAKRT